MKIYSLSCVEGMLQKIHKKVEEQAVVELFKKYHIADLVSGFDEVMAGGKNKLSQRDIDELGEGVFQILCEIDPDSNDKVVSWEKFQEVMLFVKRQEAYESELYDLVRRYRDVVGDAEGPVYQSTALIVDLLGTAMGAVVDDLGYTGLLWWVYEADFGSNEKMLESFEDTKFPEGHEFRRPYIDCLNTLYRYTIAEKQRLNN